MKKNSSDIIFLSFLKEMNTKKPNFRESSTKPINIFEKVNNKKLM
jgi:hypothetical protein